MLLAIDVGNTQTTLGVYEGERLVRMWRVATNKAHAADDLRLKIAPLLEADGVERAQIRGSVLASVVPALTQAWCEALHALIGTPPVVCSAERAGSLFSTTYPNPLEIGADRVADAVGARAAYGAPVIVVDFGTATNIEVIDAAGAFVGGIIAPGFETSAAALFSHATKLAATELADPGHAIGRSSVEAIQAGIVYGEVERVDGLVRRVCEELGQPARVVATGGFAEKLAPLSRTIDVVDPKLTLTGLKLIFDSMCEGAHGSAAQEEARMDACEGARGVRAEAEEGVSVDAVHACSANAAQSDRPTDRHAVRACAREGASD